MRISPLLTLRLMAAFLLTSLFFASCSKPRNAEPEPPPPPPPAAAPASVTNSRDLISKNPKEQYLAIKRAFEKIVPAQTEVLDDNSVDLLTCSDGTDYLGVDLDDPIAPLANLAYEVVQFAKSLKGIGYPESVWNPLLAEFEEEQLPLRIREMGKKYDQQPSEVRAKAFKERMIGELNAYRDESNPDLPRLIYEGNCGAGEVGVNIALDPTDGRAFFIPVFFFELCKAQSLDPHNQSQCNRWREPVSGLLMDVSGDYVYRATWSDGTSKDGRLSFTNLEEGQTVTLRKN